MTIDDYDTKLQRIFDDRLARYIAPSSQVRPAEKSRQFLIVATTVFVLIVGSLSFASEVNSAANAVGAACTDALTKVHVWAAVQRAPTAAEKVATAQDVLAMKQACNIQERIIGSPTPRPDRSLNPAAP